MNSAFDLPTGSVVATKRNVYIKNAGFKTWSGFMQDGHASHDIQSGWIEGLFSDELATVLRVGHGSVNRDAIAELIARECSELGEYVAEKHAGEIADAIVAAGLTTAVPDA